MIINKKPITTHIEDQLVTKTENGSAWTCWLESDPKVQVKGSTEKEAIENMLDVLKLAEFIN